MRFGKVVALVALLACVFAGAASALDFNDESEEAPIGEVGKIYEFKLLGHGGCFYAPYRYVVESGVLVTARAAGTARVTVRAKDAAGGISSKTFVVSAT